jgi:hypothetical protein
VRQIVAPSRIDPLLHFLIGMIFVDMRYRFPCVKSPL